MSVFNTSAANIHFINARQSFSCMDYKQAFEYLVLGFLADHNYKPLYQLTASLLQKQKATEELQLFQQALNRFYFHEPFFQLGYYYIDKGNYALAEAFLEKAFLHAPNSRETAYELSLALTARFKVARAVEVLKSIDYSSDFWLYYRLQFCRLLNDDIEGITDFIDVSKKQLTLLEENAVYATFKLEELEEQLIRYKAYKKYNRDIHFWQYVQYGTCIIDTPITSTSISDRYIHWHADLNFIRNILEKLCIYLATLHKIPEKIMAFPDRDSEIIGRAIALLLNKEFLFYKEYENTMDSLIVAGNSSCFNGIDDLIEIKENQSLFAFYTFWDQGAMLCPDISGFLCKSCSFPWYKNAKENYFFSRQKQLFPAKFIAESIVNNIASNTIDFETVLDIYLSVNTLLKGGKNDNKKRLSFMIDSPVDYQNKEETEEVPQTNTDII